MIFFICILTCIPRGQYCSTASKKERYSFTHLLKLHFRKKLKALVRNDDSGRTEFTQPWHHYNKVRVLKQRKLTLEHCVLEHWVSDDGSNISRGTDEFLQSNGHIKLKSGVQICQETFPGIACELFIEIIYFFALTTDVIPLELARRCILLTVVTMSAESQEGVESSLSTPYFNSLAKVGRFFSEVHSGVQSL